MRQYLVAWLINVGTYRETIFSCWTYKRRDVPWDNIWLLDLFSNKRRNVLWGTILTSAAISGWNVFSWKSFVATILIAEDWVLKGSLRIQEKKGQNTNIFLKSLKPDNQAIKILYTTARYREIHETWTSIRIIIFSVWELFNFQIFNLRTEKKKRIFKIEI